MQVKEIMSTAAIWCEPSEDVQQAAKLMQQWDAGLLTVLENPDSRCVVGIVTDRDLCLRVIAHGLDPRVLLVKECMTVGAVTCSAKDSASHALDLMVRNRVRRLPVVDAHNRLVGLISIEDLARHEAVSPTRISSSLKQLFQATREQRPQGVVAAKAS